MFYIGYHYEIVSRPAGPDVEVLTQTTLTHTKSKCNIVFPYQANYVLSLVISPYTCALIMAYSDQNVFL